MKVARAHAYGSRRNPEPLDFPESGLTTSFPLKEQIILPLVIILIIRKTFSVDDVQCIYKCCSKGVN